MGSLRFYGRTNLGGKLRFLHHIVGYCLCTLIFFFSGVLFYYYYSCLFDSSSGSCSTKLFLLRLHTHFHDEIVHGETLFQESWLINWSNLHYATSPSFSIMQGNDLGWLVNGPDLHNTLNYLWQVNVLFCFCFYLFCSELWIQSHFSVFNELLWELRQ